MGPGASTQQNFNAKLSALGDAMGVDTSGIKGQVAGYTDFNKLAGQLTRQSIKETGSSRAGIQEMQMVSGSLPSPDMSKDGFRSVANQIKGLNDFAAAKQQAGQAWLDQRHSMAGFETSWNKNISPASFVLHRLQQDQPSQTPSAGSTARSATFRPMVRRSRSFSRTVRSAVRVLRLPLPSRQPYRASTPR